MMHGQDSCISAPSQHFARESSIIHSPGLAYRPPSTCHVPLMYFPYTFGAPKRSIIDRTRAERKNTGRDETAGLPSVSDFTI
jgi:hypothetical protein